MKICLVHNEYEKFSGEESVVAGQTKLLLANGHEIVHFKRASAKIPTMLMGQLRAFCSGIYNPFVKKNFREFLKIENPDIIHIHNLFPLISPAILDVCREVNLPVVMTVHNYRLICPNGLFLSKGEVCERCSGGREYWCVLRNCEGNLLKSLGYALRNMVTRKRRSYLDNVHIFAVLTEFQKQKLTSQGFDSRRIMVIPNMINPQEKRNEQLGDYIGYVGRVSPEKGVDTLVETAKSCPDITFKAAGDYEKCQELPNSAPKNFSFLGQLSYEAIDDFIVKSRIIVMCSVCYEGFPAVLAEAMMLGKPVIASRMGGIPEIVDDGITGTLFEAGDAKDLTKKIQDLWNQPELCHRMGKAGHEKALREYSTDKYYQRLMKAYGRAKEAITIKVN